MVKSITKKMISSMPHVIIEHIFGFMSISELFSTCTLVSKSWNLHKTDWTSLDLDCDRYSLRHFEMIIDKTIPKKLIRLKLYGDVTSNEHLSCVKFLAHLQRLYISESDYGITDHDLEHIRSLVHLQSLDISDCTKITDQGFEHIGSLVQLKRLNLSWCFEITDQGLCYIKSLVQLQTLNLSGCDRITDHGLNQIRSIVQKVIR